MSRHFVQVGWSQLSMRSRHALRLAVQSGARWVVDTLVRVTIDSFDAVGKKISRPLTPLFFLFSSFLFFLLFFFRFFFLLFLFSSPQVRHCHSTQQHLHPSKRWLRGHGSGERSAHHCVLGKDRQVPVVCICFLPKVSCRVLL